MYEDESRLHMKLGSRSEEDGVLYNMPERVLVQPGTPDRSQKKTPWTQVVQEPGNKLKTRYQVQTATVRGGSPAWRRVLSRLSVILITGATFDFGQRSVYPELRTRFHRVIFVVVSTSQNSREG